MSNSVRPTAVGLVVVLAVALLPWHAEGGGGAPRRALLQDAAPNVTYATGLKLPDGPILRNSLFSSIRFSTCPGSWDWRTQSKLSAVKNQLDCGSCWAFTATGAMEAALSINTGNAPLDMSEKELVDCETESSGCNGGWYMSAFKYVGANSIALGSTYPYVPQQDACPTSLERLPKPDIQSVSVPPTEDDLKTAVCNQPVAVAIHASDEFQAYTGGIFNGPCSSDAAQLNHAVLVVGYGTDEATGTPYWIVRNSWGEAWGEDGHIRMAMNSNLCGIANFPAFPRVAGSDGQPRPEPVSGCSDVHTVVSGDTLSAIADKYVVDLQAILDVNPDISDPDVITEGQAVNIPPCSAVPSRAPAVAECGRNYTIAAGDTMYGLAIANNVTLGEMAAANPQVKDINLILAGETLTIPQPCAK